MKINTLGCALTQFLTSDNIKDIMHIRGKTRNEGSVKNSQPMYTCVYCYNSLNSSDFFPTAVVKSKAQNKTK